MKLTSNFIELYLTYCASLQLIDSTLKTVVMSPSPVNTEVTGLKFQSIKYRITAIAPVQVATVWVGVDERLSRVRI